MDMDKQYKPNEFGKLLNVSVRTLQRWDKEGFLIAFRSPTNRRYYTHTQYVEYVGNSFKQAENKRKVVIYTRRKIMIYAKNL